MNESISEIRRLLEEIEGHLKAGTMTDTRKVVGQTGADRCAGLDVGPHGPGSTTVAPFDRDSVASRGW